MKATAEFRLPEELKPALKKATKLEWITIGYLISVIVLMNLVAGSSQAMKTAWIEDALSTLPGIAFLVAGKYFEKPPSKKFPYGFHRTFSIAFLTGSVALFSIGCFLAIDSLMALVKLDRPTIGTIIIFDRQIWMGWMMILVLFYSAIPAMVLGFKKLPLAKKLHNKILHTDADTQKADYQTAVAAIAGVIGIYFGLWWMDSMAALFISVSVIVDGVKNLKNAISDLMDRSPMDVTNTNPDPLIKEIHHKVLSYPWVEDARIRFREHGQVYFGEVFVKVKTDATRDATLEDAKEELQAMHWKIHDVTIMPVSKF
ncbi:cation diffusion facilitator family transporter [Algoriphagus sp.]|uniref:cation diffusion facilitator family transporter n=1 Tax=Algoriphagus sp. TaxID=1872435 RepID=UPI003F701A22